MKFCDLFAQQPSLAALVTQCGFISPTPVQLQALPVLLAARDVLMQAPTGSGKTLAFLLRCSQLPSLVLLPTRELAQQVSAVAGDMGLTSLLIHGGTGRDTQLAALRQQQTAHLIIATPGRLMDLLSDQPDALHHVQLLVLDEGDHLPADGFADQVDRIRHALPQLQQRVCCSATWPPALVALAQDILITPEAILVDRDQVPPEVDQWVYHVHGANKQFLLQKMLRKHKDWQKVMVFTRSKMGADRIARALKRLKVSAASVHGGCRQNQRQRTMASFDAGEIRVLVTTDLAGRGLDFSQVEVVINFNLPSHPSQYVHRVGRTGRAGFSGTAISFVDDREVDELAAIESLLGAPIAVQEDHPYAGKGPPPPPPWKQRPDHASRKQGKPPTDRSRRSPNKRP